MKAFAHTAAVIGCGLLLLVALAQSPAQAQVPQLSCGNEGESPCGPADGYPYICDTGLLTHLYLFRPDICGCTERDPIFGICLAPIGCDRCVNYTRRKPTVDLLFLGGWADWALKNQRELAQDEPLNWVMHIATHNSYNTVADGHALVDFPNQYYSITDQLRAGARVVTLDLYHLGISPLNPTDSLGLAARLCHSDFYHNLFITCYAPGDPLIYLGFPPGLRYYSNGIKEIRNWLEDNPNEILILDFEDYEPLMHGPQSNNDEAVLAPIRAYLANLVLKPPPPASVTGSIATASFIGSISTGVLTVTAIGSGTLHVGDQINGASIPPGTVIQSFGGGTCPNANDGTSGPFGTGCYVLSQAVTVPSETITTGVLTVTAVDVGSGALHVDEPINGTSIPDGTFIQSFGTGTGGTGTYNLNITTTLTVPSETIGTTSGKFPDRWPTRREMLAAGKHVIVVDNHYDSFNFAQQDPVTKTYSPSEFLFSELKTVAGTYDDGTWFAKNQRRFPGCFDTPDFNADFHKTLFTKATNLVEERELGITIFGLLNDPDIVSATECNYSIIILDKFSQLLDPLNPELMTQIPDFHRQALAVWSWKEGDRGQNGNCAMLEGLPSLLPFPSRRWASADCGGLAKFACARPRSQSGKDPLQWQDPLGDDWRVTNATGSWDADAGTKACQAEFGSDFVFSVPVNGYQNRKLKDAHPIVFPDIATDNIWLNYSQRNGDGKWVIGGVTGGGGSSTPPVAKAGPNQVVECGNSVNLDADGSYSRDGGTLSYKWQGPFGIRTTQIVNLATPGDLPLGVDPIGLTVTDSGGGTATDSLTVTVQDTTPPSLTVSLSTGSAPRHSHFVPVVATITSKDSCDSEPPRIQLVSIELVPEKDHDKDHDKDHEKDHGKDHEKDHDRIVTYFRNAQFGTDDRTFELARGEEHDRTYIVTYSATDLSGNVTKISAQVVVEEAHDD